MLFKKSVDKSLERRLVALEDALSNQARLLKVLTDDSERMDALLAKLRGMVYAHKMHKAKDSEDQAEIAPEARKESKAELLRRAGFFPGRPMVHSE